MAKIARVEYCNQMWCVYHKTDCVEQVGGREFVGCTNSQSVNKAGVEASWYAEIPQEVIESEYPKFPTWCGLEEEVQNG